MGHGWKGCGSALAPRSADHFGIPAFAQRGPFFLFDFPQLCFIIIHLIFQTVGTVRRSVTALLHLNRKLGAERLLVAAMLAATCSAPRSHQQSNTLLSAQVASVVRPLATSTPP